jgi:ParB-like chromosome segregation protein Spo0J
MKEKKSEIGFITLPLEVLRKADWNYKRPDERLQAQLTANIKRNGQIENIVVRDKGKGVFEVVNGNHRLDAFAEAGLDTVIAYNLGIVSDSVARRISIELNETRFESDALLLSDAIQKALSEFSQDDLKATLPFTTEEFNDLLDIAQFHPAQLEEMEPKNIGNEGQSRISLILTKDLESLWVRWLGLVRNTDKEAAFAEALTLAIAVKMKNRKTKLTN